MNFIYDPPGNDTYTYGLEVVAKDAHRASICRNEFSACEHINLTP